MAFSNIVRGIGKGVLFGYGRFLGMHNPLGNKVVKAKDPFISLGALLRLSRNPELKAAVAENLAGRLMAMNIIASQSKSFFKPSEKGLKYVFNKFDRSVLFDTLIRFMVNNCRGDESFPNLQSKIVRGNMACNFMDYMEYMGREDFGNASLKAILMLRSGIKSAWPLFTMAVRAENIQKKTIRNPLNLMMTRALHN